MNFNYLVKAMEDSVGYTFENMLFTPIDSFEETDIVDLNVSGIYLSSIEFQSPYEGSIKIFMDKDILQKIMNLMVSDEQVDQDKLCDSTISEILNTIAGRFLAQVAPERQEIEFGLPNNLMVDEKIKFSKKDLIFEYQCELGKFYSILSVN